LHIPSSKKDNLQADTSLMAASVQARAVAQAARENAFIALIHSEMGVMNQQPGSTGSQPTISEANLQLQQVQDGQHQHQQQQQQQQLHPLPQHQQLPQQHDQQELSDAQFQARYPVGSEEWLKQRRESHKAVEKRRRERINEGLEELADIIPDGDRKKNRIIGRAVKYIKELKSREVANQEKWTVEKLLCEQA
jgi:hypothetical protein